VLQSRSGRGGEEKNSQPPPGIEPPNRDRPARSQSLYGLSYPCSCVCVINLYHDSVIFRSLEQIGRSDIGR
jgi:hypothetical protein